MYSETYRKAVADAQAWLETRLKKMPETVINEGQRREGTDGIHRDDIKMVLAECSEYMLNEHGYELSYSQRCQAFFGAAKSAGRLRQA